MFNNDRLVQLVGNCLYIDTQTLLTIESSYFLYNKIDTLNGVYKSGNPCINAMNPLSRIHINFSNFKANQAFDLSNCLQITGISFNLTQSLFEENSYISKKPDLRNTGALSISSDQAYLWNVTFVGNQAFKAAAILILNLNGLKQEIYFENVKRFFFDFVNLIKR